MSQVQAPAWQRVQQSLVVIGYETANGPFVQYGTAFCIHSDARSSEFLTDNHVVVAPKASGPLSLVVRLPNSTAAVPATIVRQDPNVDLAIVSAAVPNETALTMSAQLPQDTQVVAVGGYPYIVGVRFGGLFGAQQLLARQAHLAPDVHMGAVSSLQDSWIVFDLNGGTVDRGNSGGPLFDPQSGDVYGVLEGYVPGSVESGSQGPSVATAYSNLAMPQSIVTAFVNGHLTDVADRLPRLTETSALDDTSAVFRLSAARGSPDAQNTLGLMYRDGAEGLARDYAKAQQYFLRSAAQGDADAESNLGIMYEYGQGVARNYEQALRYYRQAVRSGNAAGENDLGSMYENARGVSLDYAQAVHYYRLSAGQGNAAGESNLGWMYYTGHGVRRNLSRAVRYFQLSAAQDNARGQANLGWVFQSRGEYRTAMQYYALAAAQGNIYGENNLGYMYRDGLGVARDDAKARHYFHLTAALGDAAGENDLGEMYEQGWGIQRSYTVASHYFALAAEQNYAPAEYNLGLVYEHGLGVAEDNRAALRYYERAAAHGLSRAVPAAARVRRLLRKSR